MIDLSLNKCPHCGKKFGKVVELIQVVSQGQIIDVYCEQCNNTRMIAAYLENHRMTLTLLTKAARLGVRHIPPLLDDIQLLQRAIHDFNTDIWIEREYLYDYLACSSTSSFKFQTHLHEVRVTKEGDLIFFYCYRKNDHQDPYVVLEVWKTTAGVGCSYKAITGYARDIDVLMQDIMGEMKLKGTDTFLENPVLVPAT